VPKVEASAPLCARSTIGARPISAARVLVSDLARQQQQHQDAQAEGRHEATLLPLTRRNHPYAYPDPKSRLHGSVGKRRRYGANATDIFIVGLTLWAR